jgi:hypothetical protein
VEDGEGWIAKGDLNGSKWEADGLRLFNVGITRAQRRLYLIANAVTIRKARTGPLRAVQRLLDAGMVQVIRAAEGTPKKSLIRSRSRSQISPNGTPVRKLKGSGLWENAGPLAHRHGCPA